MMGGRSHGRAIADPRCDGRDLRRPGELAWKTGRSPAEVANEAVQRFVEYEGWKADKIERGLRAADAGDFASGEEMQAVFDRYRHAADEQG